MHKTVKSDQHAAAPPVFLIAGAGIAGLTAAIALRRLGYSTHVFDKVKNIDCYGSGMSIIGHSLDLLHSLGVDVTTFGTAQHDISLRAWTDASIVYQVPMGGDADATLYASYGSVQYNVHRGELQQALLAAYLATGAVETDATGECDGGGGGGSGGGARVSYGKRLERYEEHSDHVRAYFKDGTFFDGTALIGADGVHSAVVRQMHPERSCLRYSGYCCWRGMNDESDRDAFKCDGGDKSPVLSDKAMLKTIVHPVGGGGRSFTIAHVRPGRQFWAFDLAFPADDPSHATGDVTAKAFLIDECATAPAQLRRVIQQTPHEKILKTFVFDRNPLPSVTSPGSRVVVIGDAAHPVVHHFGQGACLAVEDAVRVAQLLHTAAAAVAAPPQSDDHSGGVVICGDAAVCATLRDFSTWRHQWRSAALLYISRWCGALYTTDAAWSVALLRLALAWPMHLVFQAVITILLFRYNSDLPDFAREQLAFTAGSPRCK
jgi:2-polyprenyl-6-methoxyphenol hydroxylase-like FAD-dependent oxidoreductase